MQLIRTIKLSLTVSSIIFLVIGFLLPSSVIAYDLNVEDGIWTDSFNSSSNIYILPGTSICEWKPGMIQLSTSSENGGRNYSFNDGGSYQQNKHKAYDYQLYFPNRLIFSLIYPSIYTPLLLDAYEEYEFRDTWQYPFIEEHNEEFAPSYTDEQNIGVVQHFRMKLQGDADDIGNLYIRWYGYAEDARKIEMFYLDHSMVIGIWKRINSTQNITDVFFNYNLSQTKLEKAIGTDNYIDICIVASKEYRGGPRCILYSDYVELESIQQEGYKIGYGFVQTRNPINLPSNAYWELLAWDDIETENTAVRYQILYENGTKYVPVENSILKGNDEGFTKSPISLASLADDYPKIKIQANLTTNDSSVTPKIFSWTITWQSQNQWQDLFSSEYRIENKNQVNVDNGVNISILSGGWPMFGQNPENTRISTGKAADAGDLYWYSDYHTPNEMCSNLVIDNNALYIPVINQTTGKGSLYKYSPYIIDSTEIKKYNYSKIIDFSYLTEKGKKIVGSPAISDRYIIVATGDENAPNYVYAFDKDKPSDDPIWRFEIDSDETICYWGSPIIADGKVFLTSWNGQRNQKTNHVNNMILALDVSNGELKWKETFPPPPPLSNSPTWSFSTPAYSEGKVVVGCMNNMSDNLFAFEANNGTLLWNISVGVIGKASPVIYDDTVYIVNEMNVYYGILKKTKVTAVNINDGNIRWEKELGQTLTIAHNIDFMGLAQSTPAIANGVLYATSPDGCVTALDRNGTELWTNKSIYSNINRPKAPILTSSPAYADGILYVGTPEGVLYALNTLTKGKEFSHQITFPDNTPIVTDPVVVDGLVFFGAEDGKLYVCGNYITSSQQISGSITSIPIQLPNGVEWKKFYANVQTNASTSKNKITFSLLDANKNLIKVLQNRSDISIKDRIIRLRAEFWAKNNSFNPKLISWNITFSPYTDTKIPFINMNTLDPNPEGWLNVVIPQFTVKVQDNDSGLLVNSAEYEIGYKLNNQTYLKSFTAQCSGVNGTTSIEQITINISKLDFYKNITALLSLRVSIRDIAGNTATKYLTFKQDTIKPSSYVNKQSIKSSYSATAKFIPINATSFDNGTDASGIKQVKLYYRYSSTVNFNGTWINFANSTKKSPQWKFNFTNDPNQYGGYFEICTVAIDNASNVEEFPTKGDASFLYDWRIPDLPIFPGETFWFKERFTSSAVFEDDFRLDTIQYRPNFESSWTTIANNINASTYDKSWSLKEEYWNLMNEGEVYYLYFKINDTLGNTLEVTQNSQAIKIQKDTLKPSVNIDIPSLETETSLSDNFTVVGLVSDQDGSGIEEVYLYYRFSEDKSNWSSWTLYEDTLNSPPFEWKFIAQKGDGYYEFRINVTDVAGNAMSSAEFRVHVFIFSFPVDLIIIMICLLVVLSLLSAIIFIKWRKTKVT